MDTLPKDGQTVLVKAKGTIFSITGGQQPVELIMRAVFADGKFDLESLGDSAAWEGTPEIMEWVGFN